MVYDVNVETKQYFINNFEINCAYVSDYTVKRSTAKPLSIVSEGTAKNKQ
jgi:hypothetical protein